MELSFSELKKRDVINVPDGRCLGRMTDLKLSFPLGALAGIIVPGRKSKGILGLFKCFEKSEVYISVDKIIKIGGDVILVDISNCKPKPPIKPPKKKCPDPKKCSPSLNAVEFSEESEDFSIFGNIDTRIDTDDY